MWTDLQFSLRALAKNPGFALIAILTAALGIGANSAMFSVMRGVLLQPLPYRASDRLVRLQEGHPGFTLNISYPNFVDWRARNQVFEEMTIYNTMVMSTLTGSGPAERVQGGYAEARLFEFLGMAPMMGRTFAEGESEAVVISYRLWQTHFGGDPGVVGKMIRLDGEGVPVIGVLPPAMQLGRRDFWFHFRPEMLVPVQLDRGNHPGFQALARLPAGVTLEQARRAMSAIAKDLEKQYPTTNFNMDVMLTPMLDATVGNIRPVLLALFGAVGFVLMIACANVANVLLARALGRSGEVAVRAALGAGRMRLLRLFLAESLLLMIAGGALGALLAGWGVDAVKVLSDGAIPRADAIQVDALVLGYTAALTLFSALLFGLVPAWQFSRVNLAEALKQGGRGVAGRGAGHQLRWALISAEVALSVVLLVGAGLMIRSVGALSRVDPGYRAANLLAFNLHQTGMRYQKAAAVDALDEDLLARLRAIPGVRGAATAWPFDLISFGLTPYIRFQDKPVAPGREPAIQSAFVSPDYFAMLGVPLRAGRTFTRADRSGAPAAAVVNEEFVRRYYPNENVLGKRVSLVGYDELGAFEIIGVVGNTLRGGLAGGVSPEFYGAYSKMPVRGNTILVRTAGDPMQIFPSVRTELAALDPDVAIDGQIRVEDALSGTVADRRFTRTLLAVFGALALMLAGAGIYGVVSYATTQRTQEIGVRMALGAGRAEILSLVLRQTVAPLGIGLAAGIASAALLTRYLATQLYGVGTFDPLTLAMVAVVLAVTAWAACWSPALRASRLDPLASLRAE
jgi:putative ABC transport system permease protein